MLDSSKRKCVALIAITIAIVIDNCCLCVQGSIFDDSKEFTHTTPYRHIINPEAAKENAGDVSGWNKKKTIDIKAHREYDYKAHVFTSSAAGSKNIGDLYNLDIEKLFEPKIRNDYVYKNGNKANAPTNYDGDLYSINIKKTFQSQAHSNYWYQVKNEGYKDGANSFARANVFKQKTVSPYMNVSQYPGENCNRVCKEGENRICYFEFTLEFYQAMGIACGKCDQGIEEDCNRPQCVVGDGWDKGVMSINRQSPGPAIQVCQHDIIIVDVHNRADGTAAALHWHGVHMKDTPFMDGVPFVTQCPIPYSNSFRYQFRATDAGTQFYHSHAGHHKANGQYGALIIRQPQVMEPLSGFYDYDLPEHHIFVTDWMHEYAETHFPGLDSEGIFPDSVLINGRGVYTNPETREQTKIPPTVYYVTPGKRYRFRLINGLNHACPVQMQIQQHNFSIVSSDSFPVFPKVFDTLISNAGERYDFILSANHTEGDFWLRFRGLGACFTRLIESYALIRYNTIDGVKREINLQIPPFPLYDEPYPTMTLLNHPNVTQPPERTNKRVIDLSALETDEDLLNSEPDHKFFLAFNNYVVPNDEIFKANQYFHFANIISNVTVVGAINNLSLVFPDYVPLTQPELMDESQFCDSFNRPAKCAGQRFCHCVHRLKVQLNSIVELIIVDETEAINPINHPFHLHGYRFMVTGMGQHPLGLPMNIVRARRLEHDRLLARHKSKNGPPFKDTVSIPSRGYVVIRLRATNPGFWLMHCHYEWHLSIGMGLVLQVGETSQMVKAPRDFPKCGNYLPPVRQSDIKFTSNKIKASI